MEMEVDGMSLAKKLTREGLLGAMREYDAGAEAFHAKHGTSERGCRYWLRHGGKRYPSKAIVAAAAEMSPKDFSGGKSRLGKLLAKHGFVLGMLAFSFLAPSIAQYAEASDADWSYSGTPKLEAIYFASGSNRPGEIRGFHAIGQALGVAALKLHKDKQGRPVEWRPELSENAENALHELAGTGTPVFLDTGAFSEVAFGSNGPEIVKELEEKHFQWVMDLATRLAQSLGSQLWCVAPDCVAHQGKTLERMARWREELRALIAAGANVMCVAQGGPEMDQAAFDTEVEALLGTTDYVRALPCNKNATTVEQARDFAAARKPGRLHLLGLGLRNTRAPKMAEAVAAVSPGTHLSYDSCLIGESVGGKSGRANHPAEEVGGPRILSQGKAKAKELIAAGRAAYTSLNELAVQLAWGEGRSVEQLSLGLAA